MAKDGTNDRLGKLVTTYGGQDAWVLPVVGGAVALVIGIGALIYGYSRPPSDAAQVVGWLLAVVGVGLPIVGFLQGRKFLEVRKRGVRFTVGKRVTEIRWDDVDSIDVKRFS